MTLGPAQAQTFDGDWPKLLVRTQIIAKRGFRRTENVAPPKATKEKRNPAAFFRFSFANLNVIA